MIYFIMLSIYHDRYNKKYMDWQSHSLKKWKQSAKKSPNKQNPKLSLIDMQTMLFVLFLYFLKSYDAIVKRFTHSSNK